MEDPWTLAAAELEDPWTLAAADLEDPRTLAAADLEDPWTLAAAVWVVVETDPENVLTKYFTDWWKQ